MAGFITTGDYYVGMTACRLMKIVKDRSGRDKKFHLINIRKSKAIHHQFTRVTLTSSIKVKEILRLKENFKTLFIKEKRFTVTRVIY